MTGKILQMPVIERESSESSSISPSPVSSGLPPEIVFPSTASDSNFNRCDFSNREKKVPGGLGFTSSLGFYKSGLYEKGKPHDIGKFPPGKMPRRSTKAEGRRTLFARSCFRFIPSIS